MGSTSVTHGRVLDAKTANEPSDDMQPKLSCKYKTQVTESWFTLTNRLLLQPPLRNTDFIRSSLDLSFLSFNSGGGELRATNKIRPANAPTTVPDFGGSTWDQHENMQVGCGRCTLGNLPFALRLSAVNPRSGLQPKGRHNTPSFWLTRLL